MSRLRKVASQETKVKMDFNDLVRELEALEYEAIGEFIESTDGATYFTCDWSDYYLRVKVTENAVEGIVVMIETDMPNTVKDGAIEEIKEVVQKIRQN